MIFPWLYFFSGVGRIKASPLSGENPRILPGELLVQTNPCSQSISRREETGTQSQQSLPWPLLSYAHFRQGSPLASSLQPHPRLTRSTPDCPAKLWPPLHLAEPRSVLVRFMCHLAGSRNPDIWSSTILGDSVKYVLHDVNTGVSRLLISSRLPSTVWVGLAQSVKDTCIYFVVLPLSDSLTWVKVT